MNLLWLSALCAVAMVAILAAGERTLPLFGGDRVLAGRATAAALMVLSGGMLAGLTLWAMRALAHFLRARLAHPIEGAPASHWMVRLDVPGLLETAAPWAAVALGLGSMALAVAIWHTL